MYMRWTSRRCFRLSCCDKLQSFSTEKDRKEERTGREMERRQEEMGKFPLVSCLMALGAVHDFAEEKLHWCSEDGRLTHQTDKNAFQFQM